MASSTLRSPKEWQRKYREVKETLKQRTAQTRRLLAAVELQLRSKDEEIARMRERHDAELTQLWQQLFRLRGGLLRERRRIELGFAHLINASPVQEQPPAVVLAQPHQHPLTEQKRTRHQCEAKVKRTNSFTKYKEAKTKNDLKTGLHPSSSALPLPQSPSHPHAALLPPKEWTNVDGRSKSQEDQSAADKAIKYPKNQATQETENKDKDNSNDSSGKDSLKKDRILLTQIITTDAAKDEALTTRKGILKTRVSTKTESSHWPWPPISLLSVEECLSPGANSGDSGRESEDQSECRHGSEGSFESLDACDPSSSNYSSYSNYSDEGEPNCINALEDSSRSVMLSTMLALTGARKVAPPPPPPRSSTTRLSTINSDALSTARKAAEALDGLLKCGLATGKDSTSNQLVAAHRKGLSYIEPYI